MRKTYPVCFFLTLVFLSCGSNEKPKEPAETPPKETPVEEADTNMRVLLEKEGVEYAYPHFSADGKQLLFQSNESGKWNLCIMDLSFPGVLNLTNDTFNSYFADWSPDNSLICFVSDESGFEEIYTMRMDGSQRRQLTKNKARNIHPYFSPDGKTLLFSSTMDGTNLELYRMNPNGSGLKKLTNTPDEETCGRFSPDGKQILFLRNNNSGLDDLFLRDLKTMSDSNLTNTPSTDGWPCWMPDGKSIVYSAMEKGAYKLFQYTLADKSLKRLTNTPYPAEDCRANVSPDGKWIVYNRQRESPKGRTNALMLLSLSE